MSPSPSIHKRAECWGVSVRKRAYPWKVSVRKRTRTLLTTGLLRSSPEAPVTLGALPGRVSQSELPGLLVGTQQHAVAHCAVADHAGDFIPSMETVILKPTGGCWGRAIQTGEISWGLNFAWEISCFKSTAHFTTPILAVSAKVPAVVGVVGATKFPSAHSAPL